MLPELTTAGQNLVLKPLTAPVRPGPPFPHTWRIKPPHAPRAARRSPDSAHGGTINPTGLRAYECATCPTCGTELRRAMTGVDGEPWETVGRYGSY